LAHSGYYRVVAQDFTEDINLYSGRLRRGVPISDPELVEEGGAGDSANDSGHRSGDAGPNPKGHTRFKDWDARLANFQFMRPGDTLFSQSGKFYKGLNRSCELLILLDIADQFRKRESGHNDSIIWSSGATAGRVGLQGQCVFMLNGTTATIYLGADPEHIYGVLWESLGKSNVDTQGEHYLTLNNDGSLTVYKDWGTSDNNGTSGSTAKDMEGTLCVVAAWTRIKNCATQPH